MAQLSAIPRHAVRRRRHLLTFASALFVSCAFAVPAHADPDPSGTASASVSSSSSPVSPAPSGAGASSAPSGTPSSADAPSASPSTLTEVRDVNPVELAGGTVDAFRVSSTAGAGLGLDVAEIQGTTRVLREPGKVVFRVNDNAFQPQLSGSGFPVALRTVGGYVLPPSMVNTQGIIHPGWNAQGITAGDVTLRLELPQAPPQPGKGATKAAVHLFQQVNQPDGTTTVKNLLAAGTALPGALTLPAGAVGEGTWVFTAPGVYRMNVTATHRDGRTSPTYGYTFVVGSATPAVASSATAPTLPTPTQGIPVPRPVASPLAAPLPAGSPARPMPPAAVPALPAQRPAQAPQGVAPAPAAPVTPAARPAPGMAPAPATTRRPGIPARRPTNEAPRPHCTPTEVKPSAAAGGTPAQASKSMFLTGQVSGAVLTPSLALNNGGAFTYAPVTGRTLGAGAAHRIKIPEGREFLGPVGSDAWAMTTLETENTSATVPGWDATHPSLTDGLTWKITRTAAPSRGAFAVFTQNRMAGLNEIALSSVGTAHQTFVVPRGSRMDATWMFTVAGRYQIDVEVTTTSGGRAARGIGTLVFDVGGTDSAVKTSPFGRAAQNAAFIAVNPFGKAELANGQARPAQAAAAQHSATRTQQAHTVVIDGVTYTGRDAQGRPCTPTEQDVRAARGELAYTGFDVHLPLMGAVASLLLGLGMVVAARSVRAGGHD